MRMPWCRGAGLLIAAWLALQPAWAECEDWADPQAGTQVRDMRILAFPQVGDIDVRMVSRASGFSYHRSAVALRWRDGAAGLQHQMLLDGMAVSAFPDIRPEAEHIVLDQDACGWQSPCRRFTVHYRYDATAMRFVVGATRWADWVFDDQGSPVWRYAPHTEARPASVEAPHCSAESVFFERP